MDRLSDHLKNRLDDLSELKNNGIKIVGYIPGGYLPEELVLASGSIPLCLIRGGDYAVVELANTYINRWIDPFCRAQIGYGLSGDDPYYSLLDLLVIPITDNHIRAISDVLDYNTGIEIFPYGIPHTKDKLALNYYLQGITGLRERLEALTGAEITDSKLEASITLCNKERALLKEICLLRKGQSVPINCKEFVSLNHYSFLADKGFMVDILESVLEETRRKEALHNDSPRILLTGSTLAYGDETLIELIEESGGVVVVEEFAEGLRHYWENVNLDGDLMKSIAHCYFWRRVPPAWFRPGKERLEFLIKLARDFNVAGVIWYQLMYRESYKVESFYFPKILRENTGLPILILDSDYEAPATESMRTRIEAFLENI